MKVSSIMTTNVAYCKGESKLDEIARLMAQYDCSALPVIDDERKRRVIGIVTERDIVRRTLARGKDPKGLTASQCMTKQVFVADQATDVEECVLKMEEHHIKHLPIIDDNRACCGMFTLHDIAANLPSPKVGAAYKEICITKNPKSLPDFPPSPNLPGSLRPDLEQLCALGSLNDLPRAVREGLPMHAQQVFFDAYNRAVREFNDPATSHNPPNKPTQAASKIAWSAVRQKYAKVGDEWVAKSPRTRA